MLMSELLQATKITRNGRISLGQDVMDRIGANVGDHVKLFEQGGFVWLVKDEAPGVPSEAKEAAADA